MKKRREKSFSNYFNVVQMDSVESEKVEKKKFVKNIMKKRKKKKKTQTGIIFTHRIYFNCTLASRHADCEYATSVHPTTFYIFF